MCPAVAAATEVLAGRRDHPSARHPRAGRQGRARQGPARRGRRRARLPHGRPRRGRRRARHRLPRGGRRGQRLPVARLPGGPNPRAQRCSSTGCCRRRGSGSLPTPGSTVPERARRGGSAAGPACRPLLWLPAGLALAFLVLPLLALLVRTPWRAVPDLLLTAEVGQALRLSLVCASSATLVCLVLGVPLAWVLARAQFPGRSLVRAPRHGAARAPAGRGRRRAAAPARPPGGARPAPRPVVRHQPAVHDAGRRHRRGVRRAPFLVVAVEGACAGPTAATRTRRPRWARRG
jgi:hypothetical protein